MKRRLRRLYGEKRRDYIKRELQGEGTIQRRLYRERTIWNEYYTKKGLYKIKTTVEGWDFSYLLYWSSSTYSHKEIYIDGDAYSKEFTMPLASSNIG